MEIKQLSAIISQPMFGWNFFNKTKRWWNLHMLASLAAIKKWLPTFKPLFKAETRFERCLKNLWADSNSRPFWDLVKCLVTEWFTQGGVKLVQKVYIGIFIFPIICNSSIFWSVLKSSSIIFIHEFFLTTHDIRLGNFTKISWSLIH